MLTQSAPRSRPTGYTSSTETPIGDSGRRRGSHTAGEGHTNPKATFVGLAQQLLVLITTLAHAIWLAIPALLSCIGTLSPLISWLLPRNHLKSLEPSSFHKNRMNFSPSSPMELTANGAHGNSSSTPTPRAPHHPLSRGWGTNPHRGHPSA